MSAAPIAATATATAIPRRTFIVLVTTVSLLLLVLLVPWLSWLKGVGPSQLPRLQTVRQRPQQEEQHKQQQQQQQPHEGNFTTNKTTTTPANGTFQKDAEAPAGATGTREEIQERITQRMAELQQQELDRLMNNKSAYGNTNNSISRIIVGGIANELNRSAVLSNCGGLRIAMVGSSHARALAFSFAGALTGHVYANSDDNTNIPSMSFSHVTSSATNNTTLGLAVCNSGKQFTPATANTTDDPKNSCALPKYKLFFDQKRICRYTYDVGYNVETCGYPSMKRWELGPRNQFYSQPASVPINHPMPESTVPQETNDSNTTTRAVSMSSLTQLLYTFKTWIYSPPVDRASMRHVQTYRPHVLVLDLSLWGCRSPVRFLKTGQRDEDDEDLARNCTLDFQNVITNWDDGLVNQTWLVIHYVNSHISEYAAMNPIPAIQNLQRTSQRMHVIVDKATVLRQVEGWTKLGHGFLGAATDIWARVALDGAICHGSSSTTVNDAPVS